MFFYSIFDQTRPQAASWITWSRHGTSPNLWTDLAKHTLSRKINSSLFSEGMATGKRNPGAYGATKSLQMYVGLLLLRYITYGMTCVACNGGRYGILRRMLTVRKSTKARSERRERKPSANFLQRRHSVKVYHSAKKKKASALKHVYLVLAPTMVAVYSRQKSHIASVRGH